MKRPLTVWISGLPGQNRLEIKNAPCPGAGKNMTQPAFFVESKMRSRESEQQRRCRRDTPARAPLIVIPTFIFDGKQRRGTVIVVRHSVAP
jgi:hypothetical protein